MNGRLKITTEKGEIYFYTICEYAYTKNHTAQIKFVYESDFRKYNMVVAVHLLLLYMILRCFSIPYFPRSSWILSALLIKGVTDLFWLQLEMMYAMNLERSAPTYQGLARSSGRL